MKLSSLIQTMNLQVLTALHDREITGGYCGDLLSWVMGKAEPGNVWITIMNNVNIVAVAALTDVACILLAEDVNVPQDIIDKANEQEINILRSPASAFWLAGEMTKQLGM